MTVVPWRDNDFVSDMPGLMLYQVSFEMLPQIGTMKDFALCCDFDQSSDSSYVPATESYQETGRRKLTAPH